VSTASKAKARKKKEVNKEEKKRPRWEPADEDPLQDTASSMPANATPQLQLQLQVCNNRLIPAHAYDLIANQFMLLSRELINAAPLSLRNFHHSHMLSCALCRMVGKLLLVMISRDHQTQRCSGSTAAASRRRTWDYRERPDAEKRESHHA
jgi:hypothetical protein